MQNMAENVFNRCQRVRMCRKKKKVTKNFWGKICTTVSGLNATPKPDVSPKHIMQNNKVSNSSQSQEISEMLLIT